MGWSTQSGPTKPLQVKRQTGINDSDTYTSKNIGTVHARATQNHKISDKLLTMQNTINNASDSHISQNLQT